MVEDAEIVEETTATRTDEQVDRELSQPANTAAPSAEPGGSASEPHEDFKLGDPLETEPEPDPAADFADAIEDADDLAIATVELFEAIRENILAPVYERQMKSLCDPRALHSVQTKMRMKKHSIQTDEYTPEELEVLDTLEQIQLNEEAAAYKPKKKERYTEKWRKFYVSMGWAAKLPPWLSLVITVGVTELPFAFPLISNWWSGRNKPKRKA